MEPDLFTPTAVAIAETTAKAEKKQALKEVADNNRIWLEDGLAALKFLSKRRDWTGEQIRLLLRNIVGEPLHHNAWGSLISAAITRKLIIPTGEYRAMETLKSHGRKTPVYKAFAG